MSVDQALIAEAKSCLALFGIGLFSSEIWVSNKYHPSIAGNLSALNIKYRHSPKSLSRIVAPEQDCEIIRYLYETEAYIVQGNESDDEQGKLVQIKAHFFADYTIIQGQRPSESCLHEFARANVGFQVWPYWREYFSSSLTRCGFPALVLPMYNLNTVVKELQPMPVNK